MKKAITLKLGYGLLLAIFGGLSLGGSLVFAQEFVRASTQATAAPTVDLGTEFAYQGRLDDGGNPVNASCGFEFGLWDAAEEGSQIGATQVITSVVVEDGLFSVMLNDTNQFGNTALVGSARWLEVDVNCSDGAEYTKLTPRQPLTAVPFAHSLRPGASISAETGSALSLHAEEARASTLVVSGQQNNSAFPSLSVNTAGSGGYGMYINKTNGSGVAGFGANNGSTGSGIAGYSANWYGVYGYTGASSHNYGFYSPDNLYTRNVQFNGALMMVVQNSAAQPLEVGDVVSFSGISPETRGSAPMVQVAALGGSSSASSVAGVVYGYFPAELLNAPPEGLDISPDRMARGTAIEEGDYLLMVIYGPAQVKTDTAQGLQAGALVSFDEPTEEGFSRAGSVLGQALESPTADQDLAYVFVTLR